MKKHIIIIAIALLIGVSFLTTSCSEVLVQPLSSTSAIAEPTSSSRASKGEQVQGTQTGTFLKETSNGLTQVHRIVNGDTLWMATYTTSSRTVLTPGDERTFTENNISVTHSNWVRILGAAYDGSTVDTTWLIDACSKNTTNTTYPDILAIAMEFLNAGAQNAKYGPNADTSEGSDFNDFLQVDATYTPHYSSGLKRNVTSWTDGSTASRDGALDCSGFMRMVWGYTGGLPMCFNVDPAANTARLPRRSYDLWDNCFGTKVMTNFAWDAQDAATKLTALNAGDLVFFNADVSSNVELNRVDHVGMYIGIDGAGNMRFVHSRKSENRGPTFTLDNYGKSILNNDGTNNYLYWVKSLVGARRL